MIYLWLLSAEFVYFFVLNFDLYVRSQIQAPGRMWLQSITCFVVQHMYDSFVAILGRIHLFICVDF